MRVELDRVVFSMGIALGQDQRHGLQTMDFSRANGYSLGYLPEWAAVLIVKDDDHVLIPREHVLRMYLDGGPELPTE